MALRVLRVIVTAAALLGALLFILASGAGLADLAAAFGRLMPGDVALVALALLGGALLASLRLKLIAADMGYRLSFRDSVAALSVGNVAGALFFQVAGQLIARGALLSRRDMPAAATIVLTGFERLAAVLVSLALAAAGAAYLFGRLTFDWQQGGVALVELTIGLAAAIVAGAYFGWGPVLRRHGPRLDAAAMRGIARGVALSLAIQLLTMAAYVVAARSLKPDLDLWDLLAASAVVMFAASLPISLAGWGLREMSAVLALGAIGLGTESALVVAILVGATSLLVLGALALGSTVANAVPAGTARASGPGYDFVAAVQWMVPLAAVTLVFFQVHLPVRSGVVNVNLADPVALLGGALFLIACRHGFPDWRVAHLGPHLLAATAALLLSFAIGVAAIGVTDWQVTKVLGWFVLLAYGATGALLTQRAGADGFRIVALTLLGVALAITVMAALAAAADGAGLLAKAPASLLRQYEALTFTHHKAIQGFSQNRNAFALLLVFALAAALVYPTRGRRWIILTLGAGLLYSGSKAGIGAAFVVVMIYGALAGSRRVGIAALAALLVLVVALVAVPYLATLRVQWGPQDDRLHTVVGGLALFREAPLFGAGLGRFFAEHGLVIHSTPVWLLAEQGIVGFVAVGLIFAKILVGGARRSDQVAVFILLATMAFLTLALVHEILYQRAFWLLMGAALAVPMTPARPDTRSRDRERMPQNGHAQPVPVRRPERRHRFGALRMDARLAIALACALLLPALSACGSIGSAVSDVVPEWAGGLPKDAPPRPGTPEYEEFRRRLENPPPKTDAPEQPQAPANPLPGLR
jgi:hypothetical protein